jgi:2-succinyl-5-enolpyruvyl-6-hydroxy-3-cyclohexene-1-carboxylate synthase
MRTRFSHINEAWAHVLVDRLHRGHRVQDICIAPGSRSAPLALAAARYSEDHPELRCIPISTSAAWPSTRWA